VRFFFRLERNSLIFTVGKKISNKTSDHFVCKNTLSEILKKTAHVLRDVENKLATALSPFPVHDFTVYACRNTYRLPCANFNYSQILHSSTFKFLIPNFTQIVNKCGKYEKEIIYTPIQLPLLRFSRLSQLLNKRGNVRITYKKASSCNHCCRGKAISTKYSQ